MKELPKEVVCPQDSEFRPFVAIAEFDFSLGYNSEQPIFYETSRMYTTPPDTTVVNIQFQKGDKIECIYDCREHVETKYWTVRFSKNGFDFSINASDFCKLFTIA